LPKEPRKYSFILQARFAQSPLFGAPLIGQNIVDTYDGKQLPKMSKNPGVEKINNN
jgi:hypothetical protein